MSRDSHSTLLRYKIDLMAGSRREASRVLWEHPNLRELFPWALARGYMVASASVPLMRVALQQCEILAENDAVARGLARFLENHIPDEIGHDEQCLEDLEALGQSKDHVRAQIPWPSIAALIGMQYYWILHRHPIAFIGYAATVEGNPVSVDLLKRVQAQTGLPEAGFRTLLWHTNHDPGHSTELDEVMDSLPLTPEQTTLIGINIAHTQNLLARSVYEMIAAFDDQTDKPETGTSR